RFRTAAEGALVVRPFPLGRGCLGRCAADRGPDRSGRAAALGTHHALGRDLDPDRLGRAAQERGRRTEVWRVRRILHTGPGTHPLSLLSLTPSSGASYAAPVDR